MAFYVLIDLVGSVNCLMEIWFMCDIGSNISIVELYYDTKCGLEKPKNEPLISLIINILTTRYLPILLGTKKA